VTPDFLRLVENIIQSSWRIFFKIRLVRFPFCLLPFCNKLLSHGLPSLMSGWHDACLMVVKEVTQKKWAQKLEK
ncbi:MAG TPA: hypothetical protein VGA28_03220, partial [Desulfurivibrionaceae bacterium]